MSYNYSSDSDVSLFDSIEQLGQQAPPSDPPSAPPADDWFKNMTPEQLESMKQYIMKQQEEAARLKKQQEEDEARRKKKQQQEEEERKKQQQEEEEARRRKKQQQEEEEERKKQQQEEEAATRRKKQQQEEEEALARLKQEDDARRKKQQYVPFSSKVFPPPRYHPLLPPTPNTLPKIPPPPPRLGPISRPSGFTEPQKTSTNPKEETKIEDVVEEPSPARKEPYKPPKSVHEMKSNSDYKEDNVRPFDFREEMERLIEENENLKDRLTKLEEKMTGVEFHIEDIDHNAEELRKDIDNSDEYALELMKLELTPKKVAKYINKIHDLKKDVADLKNAQQAGPPTTDSFAEKYVRTQLMDTELDHLRYMFDTIPQTSTAEQTSLFKTYGWKLSNCIYHLRPYLSPEEKEKLDNSCDFVKKDKRQSPKQVMKNIKTFNEGMIKNQYQQKSDMKSKGNEFQYNFPHLDDDDNGYPQ